MKRNLVMKGYRGAIRPVSTFILVLGFPVAASAQCVTSGSAISCTVPSGTQPPVTVSQTTVGSVTNGLSVTVGSGAVISTLSNSTANLTNDAVVVGENSTIEVAGTVETESDNIKGKGGTIVGQDSTDTIEGERGTTITVDSGGQVLSTGTQPTAEAINLTGTGNTIINNGAITAQNADAIYFDDERGDKVSTDSTTIINNGTIAGYLADNTTANPNANAKTVAIGEGGGETFNITNDSGATIEGDIVLNKGATNLTLDPNSTITGYIKTDGNTANNINLSGDSSTIGVMSTALQGGAIGFANLDKTGTSTWEVDKSISSELSSPPEAIAVDVEGGTLALTADNSSFKGTTTVGSAGTLKIGDEADGATTAGSLTGAVADSGKVVFDNSATTTMTGLAIGGSGAVAQEGDGTTTLDTAQSYTGATTINAGTLALTGSGSIATSSGVTVASGGTFDISGTTSGSSVQSLAGTGAVSLGGETLTLTNASGNYGGNMSGTGGLTVSGGTETLSG
ncbi:beta strand repeat-containing protein, partial [Novacetimonas cocois]